MTDREILKSKADTLTESEIAEALEYIAIMESPGRQASRPNPFDEALLKLLRKAMGVILGPPEHNSPFYT